SISEQRSCCMAGRGRCGSTSKVAGILLTDQWKGRPMNRLLNARRLQLLVRFTPVAGDIMTPNPVSIDHFAKVQQGAVVLSERGLSAVPVINEAGSPVGDVSRTDIVRAAGGDFGTARCALSCEDCGSSAIVPRDIH